jgi:ESS family glutamate:Na+ symporter
MGATFLPYIVALGWVSFFILIGTALRAKIAFLQRNLVPTSLIAGTLGFICINLGWVVVPTGTGWETLKTGTFGVLVAHLFAIGFVGIGLLKSRGVSSAGGRNKMMLRGSLWMALIFSLMFSLQAITGFSVFTAWRAVSGGGDEPLIGYLLGAGFAQGPGQTMAYASIYEGAPYLVRNAINIGLTFAAVGFFAATIVGVPLARYGLRKGWSTLNTSQEIAPAVLKGVLSKEERTPCAYTVTHPSNIDTFAFHFAIIFLLYLVAYFFGIFWQWTTPAAIAPLGIGLIFFWGMCAGKLARIVASKAKVDSMFDEDSIRRFTGLCIDLMVAAVFMSIEFTAIKAMLVPIILCIILGTALTLLITVYLGRRVPELGLERTLLAYGTCTGTVATGLLLVRIADPNFETIVAEEAGLWNVISFFTFAHIQYLAIPFAALAGFPSFWIFAGTVVVVPVLLKVLKLWGKPLY